MAVIAMQKIKLVASTAHRQRLMDALQRLGMMEVTEILADGEKETIGSSGSVLKVEEAQAAELNIANIDFALKIIKPFAKQRNLIQGPLTLSLDEVKEKAKEFNFDDVVKKCRAIEEVIVSLKNEHALLSAEQEEIEPWQSLSMPLNHVGETDRTKTVLGTLQKTEFDAFAEEAKKASDLLNIEVVQHTESTSYLAVTYIKEEEKAAKELFLNYKFSEVELPSKSHDVKTELSKIKVRKGEIEKELSLQDEELKVLAKNNDDLQIVHDYFVWERDKIYANQFAYDTEYSFTLEGWVPVRRIAKIKDELEKHTHAFEIFEVEPNEGEHEPVAIRNKGLMGAFESVTGIYGLPLAHEIDPTPLLSAFFIIFFGLCLTDAGYGIVLFVVCALALKFLKLPEGMKKLVTLLMLGGIVTFVLGALFGGWFGMTAEQAPGFLTYVNEAGETAFRWQIITPAEGTGPLTFLILAAALGYIQVLFGILVDGYWKIKRKKYLDALFDSFLWFYFLVVMGLFGVSSAGIFLGDYAQTITYLVWFGVGALILTQGRDKKNIVVKLLSGILSLYGLVGYFADILSYSRLMALGLGTGIIGFAFNTIGGLVSNIPIIGIVFAIIVILIGHVLNIAISTLGAFIHSSRLQFVEFFGKFMEGGGKAWKPLTKQGKYILIKEK